jgi:hypothetical protein
LVVEHSELKVLVVVGGDELRVLLNADADELRGLLVTESCWLTTGYNDFAEGT